MKPNSHHANLTGRQTKIVTDPYFPRYLTAGPGTGKTEVLICKVAHLVRNMPDNYKAKFAVITYTNKATDEMRNRLNDKLDGKRMDILEVSTIHSFCYKLLRKYGSAIGFSPGFSIKSYENEVAWAASDAVWQANEPLTKQIPIRKLRHIINGALKECYTHGIVPSMDYIKPNKQDDALWTELEAAIMRICIAAHSELELKKRQDDAMTLNDLITMTRELLEDEQIAKRIASEYEYVFIDEFQDTNASQLDIVRLLINVGVKVFLIGDEKQSIYAFRGADIECSRQAKELMASYHSLDDFEINENFRTDQALITEINAVFSRPFIYKNRQLSFLQAPLVKTDELQRAPAANSEPFRIKHGEGISAIVTGLLEESLHGHKIKHEDIYILCRTNGGVRQVRSKLMQNGITCAEAGHVEEDELSEYLENDLDAKLGYTKARKGVNVLTIHKAKGLSLPVVIVPNIDRNLIRKRAETGYLIDRNAKIFALANVTDRITASQKYLKLQKEKTILRLEEELRILYVAMTRAEHVLILACPASKEEIRHAPKDKNKTTWNDLIGENSRDSKLQRLYKDIIGIRFFNGRRK